MTVSYSITDSLNEENWALIPSDPAVFNDMIKQYGINQIRAEDIYTLDLSDYKKDKNIHGLMFISKYDENSEFVNTDEEDPDAKDIIFTSQVVTNVCGTLALLAILFNADIGNKGPIIEQFLKFTEGFTPVNRGLCIGNSADIRKIHDAYGRDSILIDRAYAKNTIQLTDIAANTDSKEVETSKIYHYTSFIYKNGFLWEIDGLKPRPIKIGPCTRDTWLDVAEPILQYRASYLAEKYPEDGQSFNLMGVYEDPTPAIRERSEVLETNLIKFQKAIASKAKTKAANISKQRREFYKTTDEHIPDYESLRYIWDELDKGNYDDIKENVNSIRMMAEDMKGRVNMYDENEELQQADAIRPKFDYFPFINALITISYKRGLVEDPDEIEKRGKASSQKKRKTNAEPRRAKKEKPVKKRKR